MMGVGYNARIGIERTNMNIVSLIVVLLIFCVVIWAVRALMSAFGIGDPIATVVQVLIALLVVLWIIQSLGVFGGGPVLRLR